MPYQIKKSGQKWVVFKKGSARTLGTHDTRKEAEAQLRALYAAERRKNKR